MSPKSLLFLASASLLALAACTTTTTTTSADPDGGNAPQGATDPIPAENVGAVCTGVGTSPGDVAVFEKDTCAAGLCVADARSGLDAYCTAACTEGACPEGYVCGAATLGEKQSVCLKDGTAAPPKKQEPQGPIGTKSEKPVSKVNVGNVTNGFVCTDVCFLAGSECVADSAGAGWEDRRKTNGSTNGGRIYTCTERVPYSNNNGTLTGGYCYCGQLPLVTVKPAEAVVACDEVCSSHGLTCSKARPSRSYPTSSTSGATTLACATKPAANVNRYVCACDK